MLDARCSMMEVRCSMLDSRCSMFDDGFLRNNNIIMENKYDYKQLDVYKEAKGLVKNVYTYMKKFPKEEQFALCDQLRRAVISIPSNIAEGSGRRSSKEQVHFLDIAFGSLCEVDCQLDVACDLGYMSRDEYGQVSVQIQKIGAMISGLRKRHLGR